MTKSKSQLSSGLITDLHNEYGVYHSFLLTHYGSLIGALELSGRDADALLPDDHFGLAYITRNIYEKVDKKICITQYFSHFDNVKIHLKKREDIISNSLSQQLAVFLNTKQLMSSHLIHYFEIFPNENLNKLGLVGFIKHLGAAPFSPRSRAVLKERLMDNAALIVQMEALEQQAFELNKTLREVSSKWDSLMKVRICSLQEIWAHKRFLANLNSDLLTEGLHEHYPPTDWAKVVNSGDIEQKIVNNTDMLRINGSSARYVRIASILDFGEKRIPPGVWLLDDHAPLKLNCNFIAMIRWTPLTPFQKTLLFKRKKDEVGRSNLNMFDLLSGKSKSVIEEHVTMKPAVQKKLNELSEAEETVDSWGIVHSALLMFDSNPKKLMDYCIQADKALGAVGMKVVWETVHLPEAFKTFQPCGGEKSLRDMYFKSTQLGAASLIYKPSEGQKTIHLSTSEEAQYILRTVDGAPFYYSPFVGGKSLEIGVGPTRSGKSFLKNTMDAHFLKYGGILRAIDIDPGTEMLAKVFREQGSIFKLSDGEIKGLNPFVSAKDENDREFIRHLRALLLGMLAGNDQENLRHLGEDEQDDFDKAIAATLALPKSMQRLGSLVGHMRKPLARKFHRWVHHEQEKGMYADLFDAAVDAIGTLDKRVAVANLQGIAKDTLALSLVMMDYFYRVTSAFENPDLRHIPKKLAIDEAHYFLKYPGIVEYIERNIRTWGKFQGGISLWTQSPLDYLTIPHWDVLRSSASTFIFTADQEMNDDAYKKAFGLTAGECHQIRHLEPKREIYIIQPELDISKKVLLEVDPWQYIISTSNPVECSIRNELLAQYGFEEGIVATIAALEARKEKVLDKRSEAIAAIKSKYYGY
jgi:type IV secretion system protein VirB4